MPPLKRTRLDRHPRASMLLHRLPRRSQCLCRPVLLQRRNAMSTGTHHLRRPAVLPFQLDRSSPRMRHERLGPRLQCLPECQGLVWGISPTIGAKCQPRSCLILRVDPKRRPFRRVKRLCPRPRSHEWSLYTPKGTDRPILTRTDRLLSPHRVPCHRPSRRIYRRSLSPHWFQRLLILANPV